MEEHEERKAYEAAHSVEPEVKQWTAGQLAISSSIPSDWKFVSAEAYAALQQRFEQAESKLQSMIDGDNYIKQFIDAKERCAAMYSCDEVYTKENLSWWAEENEFVPREEMSKAATRLEQAERERDVALREITILKACLIPCLCPDGGISEECRHHGKAAVRAAQKEAKKL